MPSQNNLQFGLLFSHNSAKKSRPHSKHYETSNSTTAKNIGFIHCRKHGQEEITQFTKFTRKLQKNPGRKPRLEDATQQYNRK